MKKKRKESIVAWVCDVWEIENFHWGRRYGTPSRFAQKKESDYFSKKVCMTIEEI